MMNRPYRFFLEIKEKLALGVDRPSHRGKIVGGCRPLPPLEIMDGAQRDIGSPCSVLHLQSEAAVVVLPKINGAEHNA